MAYQQSPVPGPSHSAGAGGGGGGSPFMNSRFGDTTLTKVFVGGLAWETQSETLRRYFEQFGEILEAVVITDKISCRSKGFGFVTFRDPESARRACADPSPIIDGRQTNCNLASLGRPRPTLQFGTGRSRSSIPYQGGPPGARGAYTGSFGYRQPVSHGYQQGLMYSPYGYATYGADYVYPQGAYNPYGGQHYLPMYGVPGNANTPMYPYSQLGHGVPGSHSYTPLQGYPGHQILQFAGPSVNAATTSAISTIQTPYPTGRGAPVTPEAQFILPTHTQFMQGSSSEQKTG